MYLAFMICPITPVLMMIWLCLCLILGHHYPSQIVILTLRRFGYGIITKVLVVVDSKLFRDIGRALFGTVFTAFQQSVTFTTGVTPSNGFVLTTQILFLAIVASGLQVSLVN